jgi:hypothetical protein
MPGSGSMIFHAMEACQTPDLERLARAKSQNPNPKPAYHSMPFELIDRIHSS